MPSEPKPKKTKSAKSAQSVQFEPPAQMPAPMQYHPDALPKILPRPDGVERKDTPARKSKKWSRGVDLVLPERLRVRKIAPKPNQ